MLSRADRLEEFLSEASPEQVKDAVGAWENTVKSWADTERRARKEKNASLAKTAKGAAARAREVVTKLKAHTAKVD